MRAILILLLMATLPSAPATAAPAAAPHSPAAEPALVDPDRLLASGALPPPPAPDSLADRADLDAVLLVQGMRTPALAAEAAADAALMPQAWAAARLGRPLVPAEAAFFDAARAGMTQAIDRAKAQGAQRPRPATRDSRVSPSLSIEGHGTNSWPSGRAAATLAWAGILSDLEPDRAQALAAAAQRSGDLRVIGGVHYPSDVAAGRMLAARYLADLRASPAYRSRLAVLRPNR